MAVKFTSSLLQMTKNKTTQEKKKTTKTKDTHKIINE